jgi:2-oxoglutarate ferredoxin oxidoreductase subunit alpha
MVVVAMHETTTQTRQTLDRATILFAGDSGDGMQLTGTQFTHTSALFGNDVSTLPDFPAEIRAPAGSLAGVSAFQLHIASQDIHTPGDHADVLVAMNPAALRVELSRLRPAGVLIVDGDAFGKNNLKKAGYDEDPLADETIRRRHKLYVVPISMLTVAALAEIKLDHRDKLRCKNFFALGLLYWLYDRPLEPTLAWIAAKFAGRRPEVAAANRLALKAGWNYGETTEAFAGAYTVPRASMPPGTYRILSGNEATALGLITAARLAAKPLVYSSYPITPASDVLHELARRKQFDVRPIQCEDEISAMGSTIGAAFGGAMAVTGTSGPGVCLKSEAINLAIMLELPAVILNVQRGGPSTGLPTKTEQSDLLQAMFGRNGESPLPVLAPASPANCFTTAIEAFRIAVRHMTPVMILSEGYLANGAEPWRIPDLAELAPIEARHRTAPEGFEPYERDDTTLARPWVIPGTPGLEHRIGGLEKHRRTGDVCYAPDNHQRMCELRRDKVERIAEFIPPLHVEGPPAGKLLVLSWGGTHGAVLSAVRAVQVRRGQSAGLAHAHLRHLNPFPRNLGGVIGAYERVLIPELNFGQLAMLIRSRFIVDAVSFSKIIGQPFAVAEVTSRIEEMLA